MYKVAVPTSKLLMISLVSGVCSKTPSAGTENVDDTTTILSMETDLRLITQFLHANGTSMSI